MKLIDVGNGKRDRQTIKTRETDTKRQIQTDREKKETDTYSERQTNR